MTTEDRSDEKQRRSYAMRVRCPYCGADEGVPCITTAGRVARGEHNQRWVEWRWQMRNRRSRMQLLCDDPRFKLSAGDILICQPYPYDAKWTVLYREGDLFEPECNQYAHDVKWVGWALSAADLAPVGGTT